MVSLKIKLSIVVRLSKIKCSSSLVVSSLFLILLFKSQYGSNQLLLINQTALSRKQKHTLIVVFLIFFLKFTKTKSKLNKIKNKIHKHHTMSHTIKTKRLIYVLDKNSLSIFRRCTRNFFCTN